MSLEMTLMTIRETLNSVFDEVDMWFDKSAEIRKFKPEADEWSIDENLEHITLTSHFLLITLDNGVEKCLKRYKRGEIIPAYEIDLELLKPIGIDNSFYWHRPEHMIPTGKKSSAEVRHLMHTQKEKCLSLLNAMPNGEGKLHQVRMSVNDTGKIDMYQWLYFIILHANRHIEQMEGVYKVYQESES